MVRLADLFLLLKADSLAVDLYRKVHAVVFVYFDLSKPSLPRPKPSYLLKRSLTVDWTPRLIDMVLKSTARSTKFWRSREKVTSPAPSSVLVKSCHLLGPYYQSWKPTKQHSFPTNFPQLPLKAQEVKDQWQASASEGSAFLNAYLIKLAIETNHVESTFLLTEGVRLLSAEHILVTSSQPS